MTTTGLDFRLHLSYRRPPLNANQSLNPYKRAKIVKALRTEIAWLGRAARIPQGSHMTVQLVYAPGRNQHMDGPNFYPTLKALTDGLARGPRKDLIGLDIVPDDTDEYVTQLPTLILWPPEPGPRCWLLVTVVPLEADHDDDQAARPAGRDAVNDPAVAEAVADPAAED
jgi:crossover junction endodeoxyribonuclease RusA